MSAAEIADRVAGPTYLRGSWLGTAAAPVLGAGACVPSSVATDAEEHATSDVTAVTVAQRRADERDLTGLH